MSEILYLAAPNDDGNGYTLLRVKCPVSRFDTYAQIMANIPADAPQPVALNLDTADVGA